MAETSKAAWPWSWLTGLALAALAFGIWYFPYGCTPLPWQAVAGAEIMACLSGICFAWFVIRLLGAQKDEEKAGTKKEEEKAGSKKQWQLFATRAGRVERQLNVIKEKSRTQKAAVLAIRAAKAQAAEEAAVARAGRMQAARDLAQEAKNIAAGVIGGLKKQAGAATAKEVADPAVQAAQKHFGAKWTEAHRAQLYDILANTKLKDPWAEENFVEVAIAKAKTPASVADDSEAAASTLADAISRALGGNAG
jgi:hypothetical protein